MRNIRKNKYTTFSSIRCRRKCRTLLDGNIVLLIQFISVDKRQFPTTVFQSLVIALVLPHLDYCNSVLYGLPTTLIRRLQSVYRMPCAAHIRYTAFRAHLSCAHQSSLAANPRAHHLQVGSSNVSSSS